MEDNQQSECIVSTVIPITKENKGQKSKKCCQCSYVSSYAGRLTTHLKTHGKQKSNKCNQCDYTCSQASGLRTHLKTHTGEKLNKCKRKPFENSRLKLPPRLGKTPTSETIFSLIGNNFFEIRQQGLTYRQQN